MAQTSTGKLKAKINEHGETVYEAPIEIRDKADLDNFGITWEDCKTLRFGASDRITVYFFETTNRKFAEEQWGFLNTQHSKGYRSTRCMVPGTQNPLIICPDSNKCTACPYGRKPEDRQARIISWEGMLEDGYELTDSTQSMETRLILEDVRRIMDRRDPNISKAIILKEVYGHSVPEIADILGITKRHVYYLLNQAKVIGRIHKGML